MKMQKRVMAVAVAGALAAPAVALAQTSTVNLYGTIVTNYNYVDQGDGAVKSDYINAHDSNFGIRGEEKLGGGMSAWFQCETSFDPSLGGDGVCARNSAVGFRGAFGNFFVGNWDTPMKLTHGPARIWSTSGAFGNGGVLWNESGSNVGNGNGNAAFINGNAGNGNIDPIPNANGASFTRRQAQLLSWHSPNWSGFQVMFAFSAAAEAVEGAGGRTLITSGTNSAKPRLWSLGGTYRNGPLYIGLGYEEHKDYNPAGRGIDAGGTLLYTGGTDKGWTLSASYTFGGNVKLSGIYASTEYKTGPASDLEFDGFGIYVDWKISGPHGLRLGYSQANDGSGTPGGANVGAIAAPSALGVEDSGAKLWGIQYYHSLSKRTEINVGYALLQNDTRSRHRLQTLGGRNTCQGAPAGCDRDQSAFVLGVRHSF